MDDPYYAKLRLALEKIFEKKMIREGVEINIIPKQFLNETGIYSLESLLVFAVAFTTKSFSYNHDENYDEFEFAGDLLINMLVLEKIMSKFKDLNSREKTNIHAYYKSNHPFGEYLIHEFGQKVLDEDLIRKGPKDVYVHDEKIYADIFEAFIYSVKVVCSNLAGLPIGNECAKNVFLVMTKDFEYDKTHAKGASKTLVTELLKKESKSDEGDKTFTEFPNKKSGGKFLGELSVVLTDKGIARARQIHKIVSSEMADVPAFKPRTKFTAGYIPKGDEPAPNKKIVTRELYDEILGWLLPENISVTDFHRLEAMYEIRKDGKLDLNKLDRSNIGLSFEKEKIRGGNFMWYLIGTDKITGDSRVVGSMKSDSSPQSFPIVRSKLLDRYLKSLP